MDKEEMKFRLVLLMYAFGGIMGISTLAYENWSGFFTGWILMFPFVIFVINFYFKTKKKKLEQER